MKQLSRTTLKTCPENTKQYKPLFGHKHHYVQMNRVSAETRYYWFACLFAVNLNTLAGNSDCTAQNDPMTMNRKGCGSKGLWSYAGYSARHLRGGAREQGAVESYRYCVRHLPGGAREQGAVESCRVLCPALAWRRQGARGCGVMQSTVPSICLEAPIWRVGVEATPKYEPPYSTAMINDCPVHFHQFIFDFLGERLVNSYL
jgi:hypothetical protein